MSSRLLATSADESSQRRQELNEMLKAGEDTSDDADDYEDQEEEDVQTVVKVEKDKEEKGKVSSFLGFPARDIRYLSPERRQQKMEQRPVVRSDSEQKVQTHTNVCCPVLSS